MDDVQVLPQTDREAHKLMVTRDGVQMLLSLSPAAAASLVLELQKQLVGHDWSESADQTVPELHVVAIRTAHGPEGAGVLVGTAEKGVLALIVPPDLSGVAVDAFARVREIQRMTSKAN